MHAHAVATARVIWSRHLPADLNQCRFCPNTPPHYTDHEHGGAPPHSAPAYGSRRRRVPWVMTIWLLDRDRHTPNAADVIARPADRHSPTIGAVSMPNGHGFMKIEAAISLAWIRWENSAATLLPLRLGMAGELAHRIDDGVEAATRQSSSPCCMSGFNTLRHALNVELRGSGDVGIGRSGRMDHAAAVIVSRSSILTSDAGDAIATRNHARHGGSFSSLKTIVAAHWGIHLTRLMLFGGLIPRCRRVDSSLGTTFRMHCAAVSLSLHTGLALYAVCLALR